jgi:hypothetical protein
MAELRAYVVTSWLNNRAQCDCGHSGKRRWIRGGAEIDVFAHYKETGHQPDEWFGGIHTAQPSPRKLRWPTAML